MKFHIKHLFIKIKICFQVFDIYIKREYSVVIYVELNSGLEYENLLEKIT
jgi:hypothetical protein